MFRKIILIAIIAIIILAAIILLLSKKEETPQIEEEKIPNEILSLLGEIEQTTGLDFSEPQVVKFNWNIGGEKFQAATVKGGGFLARGVSSEQIQSVESYFGQNDFTPDVYNIAAGTISWATGYRKELTVCLLTGAQWTTEEGLPAPEDKNDLNIMCAVGDESITPTPVSKETAIREALAQKHNTKISEVSITIEKETENHVRGGVKIPPDAEAGGIFLAAKKDDRWVIAFDGNGQISCEELEKYNFPEEMKSDCANTQNIDAQVEKTFSILLESNLTTGYSWKAEFSAEYLELIKQQYEPSTPQILGSGGIEKFDFGALKQGQTEIKFSYLRPWETDAAPIDQKVYKIIIK